MNAMKGWTVVKLVQKFVEIQQEPMNVTPSVKMDIDMIHELERVKVNFIDAQGNNS